MKKKGIVDEKIILRLDEEVELADWAIRMDEETRNTPGRIAARFLIEVKEMLLQRMEEEGIIQQQLADKMGVKQSYISKFFNHSNNINVNTLVKVSHALGLSVEPPKMVDTETQKEYIRVPNYEAFESCHTNIRFESSEYDEYRDKASATTHTTQEMGSCESSEQALKRVLKQMEESKKAEPQQNSYCGDSDERLDIAA